MKKCNIIGLFTALTLLLSACGGGGDSVVKELLDCSAPPEITTVVNTSKATYTKLDNNTFINEKDNVIVYVRSDLNKSAKLIYDSAKIEEITKHLYQYVEDKYDFIFLITNNAIKPSTVTYSGVFSKVKNDVKGIGVDLYSNSATYGSAGALKGIMHFAYRKAIIGGPTLHEISHYWANKFKFSTKEAPYYLFGSGSHWGRTGFFGGKGQLGGYDAKTFRDEKKTYATRKGDREIYSAENFGWNANGGNRIPYNDVELYLMGMIPISDVKDLLIPIKYASDLSWKDANASGVKVDTKRKYFIAESVSRKSMQKILDENNIVRRKPDSSSSQKEFNVLTVLLDTKMPENYQVESISFLMNSLAYKCDDGNDNNFNFSEATRGKGSLVVKGISKTLKTAQAQEVTIDTIGYSPETITFHGFEYKTILSPYTGRIWLDRNIGANQVCQSVTDSACFGDYFAFGRGMDGHEKVDSNYTEVKATSVDNAGNKFIYIKGTSSTDWVEAGVDDNLSKRAAFFSTTDGTGVCPRGFRVPTKDEIAFDTYYNERLDTFENLSDAEKNFLKLPAAGYRNAFSTVASRVYDTTQGFLWTSTLYTSSTTSEVSAKRFSFSDTGVTAYTTSYFADGMNIRCIQAE